MKLSLFERRNKASRVLFEWDKPREPTQGIIGLQTNTVAQVMLVDRCTLRPFPIKAVEPDSGDVKVPRINLDIIGHEPCDKRIKVQRRCTPTSTMNKVMCMESGIVVSAGTRTSIRAYHALYAQVRVLRANRVDFDDDEMRWPEFVPYCYDVHNEPWAGILENHLLLSELRKISEDGYWMHYESDLFPGVRVRKGEESTVFLVFKKGKIVAIGEPLTTMLPKINAFVRFLNRHPEVYVPLDKKGTAERLRWIQKKFGHIAKCDTPRPVSPAADTATSGKPRAKGGASRKRCRGKKAAS